MSNVKKKDLQKKRGIKNTKKKKVKQLREE